jgi:hypothetical protein
MNCPLNAPQVAAYVDSGEALAKMLLSIVLCISAMRKFVAQIRNFPISPKGTFSNRRGESSARELFRGGSGFSRLVIIRELPTLHSPSNECRFEERVPDLKRSLPETHRGLREADALSLARFPTFRANSVRTTGRISPQAQAIHRAFRAR